MYFIASQIDSTSYIIIENLNNKFNARLFGQEAISIIMEDAYNIEIFNRLNLTLIKIDLCSWSMI